MSEEVVKDSLLKEREVSNYIEDGEELLHKIHSFAQNRRNTKVMVSVDCGSTQTRVKVVDYGEDGAKDFDSAVEHLYIIPSDYIYTAKLGSFVPDSQQLIDNMATRIVNIGNPTGGIVPSGFLVRGNLAEKRNDTKSTIGSSGQKIANPNLYYNILDAVGYALMLHFGNQIPEKVEIYLSLALPPKEATERNMKILRETLNSFKWTHISKISIDMEFKGFATLTEPEAQAKAQQALSSADEGETSPSETIKLTIEIGGRSIGLNIMKGYITIPDTQKTLHYGGKAIVDSLIDAFEAKYGGDRVKPSVMMRALKTGFVVQGAKSKIDITPMIIDVKNQFAANIARDVRIHSFDNQTIVSASEISLIEISGRTASPGDYDYSLADRLASELFTYIKNAEYDVIDDNLIPLGLLLHGANFFNLDDKGETVQPLSFDEDDFGAVDTFFSEAAAGSESVESAVTEENVEVQADLDLEEAVQFEE